MENICCAKAGVLCYVVLTAAYIEVLEIVHTFKSNVLMRSEIWLQFGPHCQNSEVNIYIADTNRIIFSVKLHQ